MTSDQDVAELRAMLAASSDKVIELLAALAAAEARNASGERFAPQAPPTTDGSVSMAGKEK